MKKEHFHSLDSLRFFAFFKVFMLHVPAGLGLLPFLYVKAGGGIGVNFFFILSGFLITYIITNHKIRGTYHVGKFLGRRFLRIMPLYLFVCVVMMLIPDAVRRDLGFYITGGYKMDWKYTLIFLENYRMLDLDTLPRLTPFSVFWSLCIEVHFYIIWAICLYWVPLRRMPLFFAFAILMGFLMSYLELIQFHPNKNVDYSDILSYLDMFGIASLLGYYTSMESPWLMKFYQNGKSEVRWLFVSLAVLLVAFQYQILPVNTAWWVVVRGPVLSVIFVLCIASFIGQTQFSIKSKFLAYLGKISYGMYVFHLIFIHMGYQYYANNVSTEWKDSWIGIWMLAMASLFSTIIVSAISYELIEKPVIKLKDVLFGK